MSTAITRVPDVLIGNAHGDLSGRNILVPERPDVQPTPYVLIDYDRFSSAAPLARDLMHLLTALALDLLTPGDIDLAIRQGLLTAIVDPYESVCHRPG